MQLRKKYARICCDCRLCQTPCRAMPGALIPGDIELLAAQLQIASQDFDSWLCTNFLASDGAMVMRGNQLLQVGSIVPATKSDGTCKFLTADSRCAVHATSPFGCAYFDLHMSPEESQPIVLAMVAEQLADNLARGQYWQQRQKLLADGAVAESLLTRRQRLAALLASCS